MILKGYERADFEEAWATYLPHSQPLHRYNPRTHWRLMTQAIRYVAFL